MDAVVGYRRAGYTPEEIAEDLLPHLDLAQVYDALSPVSTQIIRSSLMPI